MPSFVLHLALESGLPDDLSAALPRPLFVCGWCFCPQDGIDGLDILVGDDP